MNMLDKNVRCCVVTELYVYMRQLLWFFNTAYIMLGQSWLIALCIAFLLITACITEANGLLYFRIKIVECMEFPNAHMFDWELNRLLRISEYSQRLISNASEEACNIMTRGSIQLVLLYGPLRGAWLTHSVCHVRRKFFDRASEVSQCLAHSRAGTRLEGNTIWEEKVAYKTAP